MKKDPYKLRTADILLAVFMIVLSLGIYLSFFLGSKGNGAKQVVVTVAGSEYGRYSLDEDQTVTIRANGGYNRLVIKDGKAYITDADCPDKYCVDKGYVSQKGQVIVCLPHKLTVKIETGAVESDNSAADSGKSEDVDAVVK